MSKEIPQLEKGAKLSNSEQGNVYSVRGCEYDEQRCQVMYILQGQRYNFNTFRISQSAIMDNLNTGCYSRVEE